MWEAIAARKVLWRISGLRIVAIVVAASGSILVIQSDDSAAESFDLRQAMLRSTHYPQSPPCRLHL